MSYRVIVTREHKSWLADVPELEGAHTWATNLPALDRAVREVIVLAADLDDDAMDDLDVDWDIRTGDAELDAELGALRAERAEVARLEHDVVQKTLTNVKRLVDSGLPVRDVAKLVGVSPQRVSQMARDYDAAHVETTQASPVDEPETLYRSGRMRAARRERLRQPSEV